MDHSLFKQLSFSSNIHRLVFDQWGEGFSTHHLVLVNILAPVSKASITLNE